MAYNKHSWTLDPGLMLGLGLGGTDAEIDVDYFQFVLEESVLNW